MMATLEAPSSGSDDSSARISWLHPSFSHGEEALSSRDGSKFKADRLTRPKVFWKAVREGCVVHEDAELTSKAMPFSIPLGAFLVQLDSKDVQSDVGSTLRRLRLRMSRYAGFGGREIEGWVTLDERAIDEKQFFAGPYEKSARQIRKKIQCAEKDRHMQIASIESELESDFLTHAAGPGPSACGDWTAWADWSYFDWSYFDCWYFDCSHFDYANYAQQMCIDVDKACSAGTPPSA
jgi:hypothetical protein